METLEQKAAIDEQLKAALLDAEKTARELESVPGPDDLKSMDEFAGRIGKALDNGREISPKDKRQIMQMLNLKVLISRDGCMTLEGWFAPENEGLLSTTWS